ncbi:hypothetical protein BaRGS_00026446 [Batillaria attramentaria]|uniref:Peptidase S1 domain-containing protein n=1 Tax=Batillaria attramentaria TaxID=370345 RepID=A0ABD0K632_9CAEN
MTDCVIVNSAPDPAAAAGCDTDHDRNCGQPLVQPASFRIVGGHPATYGAWPWTVILTEQDFATCGGAIIHNRVILTAAHCFEDQVSRDVSRWQVVAGKYHLLKQDRGEKTFNVMANDVALLLLRESISYTSFIKPICLPSPDITPSVGQGCLLAGWGDTHGTGTQEVMNQVTLPVISDDVCSRPDWYGHEFLRQTTFCAGYEQGGRDACTGDSGGPLVCKFDDRWYVSGIASWGYGCAEIKWPGIYTNVTYYLPWIKQRLLEFQIQVPCHVLVG